MNDPNEWAGYYEQSPKRSVQETIKDPKVVIDTLKSAIEYLDKGSKYDDLKREYNYLDERFRIAIQILNDNNLIKEFQKQCIKEFQ